MTIATIVILFLFSVMSTFSYAELKLIDEADLLVEQAKKDPDTVANIKALAASGDPAGENKLGLFHLQGVGMPKNPSEAFHWFEMSANHGNASAMSNLAGLYFKGVGTSQDYPRAFEWYTKAASKEYIPAMYLLGSMYFLGLGTARDYQLAAYWTRKAAEQGFADAQNNLAVLYGEGKGLPKDHLKAIEWLRKAANQQHSASLLTLGSIYANGLGVQRSFIVAYAMYTVAAVKDKLNAQFYLYTISQGMSKEEINSAITLSKEMLIKDNFLIALDHFTSSKNE